MRKQQSFPFPTVIHIIGLVETIKSKGNEIRNKHKWGPILLSCSDGESIVKELLTRLGLFCIVWAAVWPFSPP